LDEPTADRLLATLVSNAPPRVSAGSMLETYLVIDRHDNSNALLIFEKIVTRLALVIEPVTEREVQIARDAYRQYGKGSGHPAKLNYGDCFAYALARHRDEPLLFVGNDFVHTDIIPAEVE
jgi:ribonuclease VapC